MAAACRRSRPPKLCSVARVDVKMPKRNLYNSHTELVKARAAIQPHGHGKQKLVNMVCLEFQMIMEFRMVMLLASKPSLAEKVMLVLSLRCLTEKPTNRKKEQQVHADV